MEPVTTLSDDEIWKPARDTTDGDVLPPLKRLRHVRVSASSIQQNLWQTTMNIVQSSCRCNQSQKGINCFLAFRDRDMFERLVSHLERFHTMDKMEIDRQASHVGLILWQSHLSCSDCSSRTSSNCIPKAVLLTVWANSRSLAVPFANKRTCVCYGWVHLACQT